MRLGLGPELPQLASQGEGKAEGWCQGVLRPQHTSVADGGAPVAISSASAACASVHSARLRTVMGESLRCDAVSHRL